MSARKAKAAATPPKVGAQEAVAREEERLVASLYDDARALARRLFELSENSDWRQSMVKPLRLSFDLGTELQKAVEHANRLVETAKWRDRQPELDLEDDE